MVSRGAIFVQWIWSSSFTSFFFYKSYFLRLIASAIASGSKTSTAHSPQMRISSPIPKENIR